jgi:hypothetical protein
VWATAPIAAQPISQARCPPDTDSEQKRKNQNMNNMNHTDGWMGGGMWLWTVIGVVVVVLLVSVISKLSRK